MTDSVIELKNIQVNQENNIILKNVDLEIKKSEFVYLIGKTGTGKTSLLRALYGDLPVKEGIAKVAGFDLEKIKNAEIPFLRRKLGIIFQDFQLLTDRSVEKNLFFVMQATGWKDSQLMDKRSQEVLNLVGLNEKRKKMPYALSGGEQQRVVIARALINYPALILADEPTGNLDPDTSDEIIGLLHKIKKEGTAVLMATHDYRIIEKFPSRIIKVENQQLNEIKL
jgi:cell division transport system ATP-binding protein